MKLHLGCGQIYLKGYTNIDYPLDNHSVQKKTVADETIDLTVLNYRQNTIDEIRLHHVFEHFSRAQACALLVSWRSWLKESGILRIEVPDFDRMVFEYLNPIKSMKKKSLVLRHIFGSQEEHWAVHYEGWSQKRLSKLILDLGFDKIQVNKNSWKGTHNFEIVARKDSSEFSIQTSTEQIENYLSNYLVDYSDGEKQMLKVWMSIYDKQIKKSYARK